MSCVAADSAMAKVSASATHGVAGSSPSPASPRVPIPSAIWATQIQPLRRPKKGSLKRSMNGAHRTLKVQGACASENRPTMRMSTPLSRIQSGMAIHTRPSGIPDEKDSNTTEAVRQLLMAIHRPSRAPVVLGLLGSFTIAALAR